MLFNKLPKTFWAISFIVSMLLFASCLFQSKKVDYNTEVKPIFNKNCIVCHGGVKRQGGFSLLFKSDALAKINLGNPLSFLEIRNIAR